MGRKFFICLILFALVGMVLLTMTSLGDKVPKVKKVTVTDERENVEFPKENNFYTFQFDDGSMRLVDKPLDILDKGKGMTIIVR